MHKVLKFLAVIALLGFPIAVIGFRLGLFPFTTSFTLMLATAGLSAIVFMVGMLVSFIKRSQAVTAKSARTAAMIALLPLIGLGTQAFKGSSLPEIHNISTDLSNPPAFDKVIALRSDSDNSLEYNIDELASIQSAAYPNVKTLLTDLSPSEAHAKSKSIFESMGLDLVNSDVEKGIIEATHQSALWGFKDDIVVRITVSGEKTAIDLRSVSRIGRSDLGANAARIEKFFAKF